MSKVNLTETDIEGLIKEIQKMMLAARSSSLQLTNARYIAALIKPYLPPCQCLHQSRLKALKKKYNKLLNKVNLEQQRWTG